MTDEAVGKRAERLLLAYPVSWRERYGEEFAELLRSEITERPRSLHRTFDVLRGGLVARLAQAGLCGHFLQPETAPNSRLATGSCCAAVFLSFATAVWAQLVVGWQWGSPHRIGIAAAVYTMSAAMLGFLVLGLLAVVPVGALTVTSLAKGRRRLLAPLSALVGCGVVLAVGARHFANGWPGTGGHHWAHQSLVPGGVAAFSWASTLSVSSYWAHPAALGHFPVPELAWMSLSPLAILGLIAAGASLLRRLELPPRLLAFELGLARTAGALMLAFLLAGALWIASVTERTGNLFRAGWIDFVALVAMGVAWLCLARVAPWRSAPSLPVALPGAEASA